MSKWHLFGKEKHPNLERFINEIKQIDRDVTQYEENMILNIIKLSDTKVKDIMVPRVDLQFIDCKATLEEVITKIEEKGVSRLPVFDEERTNIIGILHAKDLLKYAFCTTKYDLKSIIRAPYFVPEIKQINDLLMEFRENKVHLSIAVDEYGDISGIVCLEDIIERIVGDIMDEFDKEGSDIIQLDETSYLVNARITLDDLNEEIGINIVEDDIDTLGGLVYMILGRIPKKGESVSYKNYVFTIDAISGRNIKKIRIEKQSVPSKNQSESSNA